MKLIKALFGRTALTIFAILLQLLISIALVWLIDIIVTSLIGNIRGIGPYMLSTIIMTAVDIVIAAITTVRIVIRDMSPDEKMSWLVVLVFAPIIGSLLYLFFSHPYLSRRRMLLHMDIRARSAKYYACKDDCADVLGDRLRSSKFIYEAAGAAPYKYSDVKYLPSGEAFFEQLKQELEKARKHIFMEYFIIERGKMWDEIESILVRKVSEGVVVKVMYDDIGNLTHAKRGFWKELRKKGIECLRFNPLRPVMSAIYNNRDHRKITVIDGVTAFVGGVNLADDYINETHRLGEWKDCAVMVRGAAVRSLSIMFLTAYDSQDDKQLENYDEYFPEFYEYFDEEGIVQPFADGPRPLYPTHVAENVILDIIDGAKKYVYITTPYLIINHNLITALCRAAISGVDVRIVTPRIPDKKIVFWITRRNYKKLLRSGVRIYEFVPGFVHAKTYLSDDEVGMVGTVNMDYRSLVHHYECGVWMYKTSCLKDIKADHEKLFTECEEMTLETARQSVPKRVVSAIGSLFAPML